MSTSISSKLEWGYNVIATKTAIIVPCDEGILVWAIPPLSPQPPDSFDHNPPHISPLFSIAYPGDIVCTAELLHRKRCPNWYDGSSQPLYFDGLCSDSLHIFEIIAKPDLFDTSLRIINTTQLTPDDVDDMTPQKYSICEDTLVVCCEKLYDSGQFEVYTWSRFPTRMAALRPKCYHPGLPMDTSFLYAQHLVDMYISTTIFAE